MCRRRGLTLVLFVGLAILHTWPLATAPGRLSRNDNADTVLNEWILAWDAHQVAHAPQRLFDANIFYPDRDTLAYSEDLLVPAAMGAPLLWLGASPVLVYNLLLLAGFALTGWATSLVVTRWTGDWWAGVLSGALLAFNASTLTAVPHLQAQHAEFFAPMLLAFDLMLTRPRVRHALALAGTFTLQALTSYYTFAFASVALTVAWLVRVDEWWSRRRRVMPLLMLAAALATAFVVPTLVPYKELDLVRPIDEVARYSATWRDYLTTGGRLHYALWSAHLFGSTALFPGLVATLLAGVALVRRDAWRDGRTRMVLAFGLVGVALSFGPALPGYRLLYALVPPLRGIRAAARFGTLGLLAVAILAGYGLAACRRRYAHARWLPAATMAVLVLATGEALRAPMAYVPAVPPDPVFAHLKGAAAIVEFPFYPPDHIFHNAAYLLDSTKNWRPMLNGYSGVVPRTYRDHYAALEHFPDRHALDALRALGVSDVVVHYAEQSAWAGQASVDAIPRTPALRLIAASGDVGVYAIRPVAPAARR